MLAITTRIPIVSSLEGFIEEHEDRHNVQIPQRRCVPENGEVVWNAEL
jgi:hypothetical protein